MTEMESVYSHGAGGHRELNGGRDTSVVGTVEPVRATRGGRG